MKMLLPRWHARARPSRSASRATSIDKPSLGKSVGGLRVARELDCVEPHRQETQNRCWRDPALVRAPGELDVATRLVLLRTRLLCPATPEAAKDAAREAEPGGRAAG
jgi:hypothetical protein